MQHYIDKHLSISMPVIPSSNSPLIEAMDSRFCRFTSLIT